VTSEERRELEARLKAVASAMQRLFATDDGAVVLKHLAGYCREGQTTFSLSTLETPQMTAFKEGQRNVIVYIRTILGLDLRLPLPRFLTVSEEETDA